MVSVTGFVTCARVQRKAEEGAANEGMEWIRQWADMRHIHLFIEFIYIWKVIRTPG